MVLTIVAEVYSQSLTHTRMADHSTLRVQYEVTWVTLCYQTPDTTSDLSIPRGGGSQGLELPLHAKLNGTERLGAGGRYDRCGTMLKGKGQWRQGRTSKESRDNEREKGLGRLLAYGSVMVVKREQEGMD